MIRQDMTLLQPDEAEFQLANATLTVLALALRRGALKHHDDWHSLVDGNELHIQWHDDFLDKPFFVRGGARGMSCDEDHPLTDNGSRQFLRRIAEEAGLGGLLESMPFIQASC
jgi:hypothetical protein